MIEDLEDIIKDQNKHLNLDFNEELLIDLLNHLMVWSDKIYNININALKHNEIIHLLRSKITREIQSFLKSYKIQIKKILTQVPSQQMLFYQVTDVTSLKAFY